MTLICQSLLYIFYLSSLFVRGQLLVYCLLALCLLEGDQENKCWSLCPVSLLVTVHYLGKGILPWVNVSTKSLRSYICIPTLWPWTYYLNSQCLNGAIIYILSMLLELSVLCLDGAIWSMRAYISPFSVTITKYLRLGTLCRKDIYFSS